MKQLVALGDIKGKVLDPGEGPGHRAVDFASEGYAAAEIDSSSAAFEPAQDNAWIAVVSADSRVADPSKPEATYRGHPGLAAIEAILARNPDKFAEIKLAALRFALIGESRCNPPRLVDCKSTNR